MHGAACAEIKERIENNVHIFLNKPLPAARKGSDLPTEVRLLWALALVLKMLDGVRVSALRSCLLLHACNSACLRTCMDGFISKAHQGLYLCSAAKSRAVAQRRARQRLNRRSPRKQRGHACRRPAHACGMHARTQMAELRRVIEADQRMYVQWAEEKLALAATACDLVSQHRALLDHDIGALLAELKARGRGALPSLFPWRHGQEAALPRALLLLPSHTSMADGLHGWGQCVNSMSHRRMRANNNGDLGCTLPWQCMPALAWQAERSTCQAYGSCHVACVLIRPPISRRRACRWSTRRRRRPAAASASATSRPPRRARPRCGCLLTVIFEGL